MGQCLSIATQVLQAAATAESQEEQTQQQQQQQQQPAQQQQQQQQQQKHDAPLHTPSSTATATTSTTSLSPIYPSLPPDAEKHRVRNVYDGDTLTLTDERRVRLLGIDTPEIKEHQPFSQEAKAYTKEKCDKRDVWISFELNLPKQDHYDRLLAFVWVQNDNINGTGGFLNVNEGIVAAGLASAYIPNQDSKLHNWDKFIKLQSRARSQKLGMWSTIHNKNNDTITVYKTANGSAFHKKDCQHLQGIKNLTPLKQSEAMDKGLHACRTCLAN